MIGGLLVDMLVESVAILGCVPRRLFIKADNTGKETKNTIVIFVALWLLANLQNTRLEVIEFGYLLVGHTHDNIDAIFSYVSKALKPATCLSIPEMMHTLQTSMTTPPIWRHLRDIYDFQAIQPRQLGSQHVKGIRQPHHYRIFRNRSGHLCIQSKRWLTSATWGDPVSLCTPAEAESLRSSYPDAVQPQWPEGFEAQAKSWLAKLKTVLGSQSHDTSGLEHMVATLEHKVPEFLPSDFPLDEKIAVLRRISRRTLCVRSDGLDAALSAIDGATATAFPGAAQGPDEEPRPLIYTTKSAVLEKRALGFCQEELEEGMYVLYRSNTSADNIPVICSGLPVRLGRVLRLAREYASNPFAVVSGMWPILKKDKYGERMNPFGTWMICAVPKSMASGTSKKRRKSLLQQEADTTERGVNLMVSISDILVWPIELEDGATGRSEDSGRIPFNAIHYLRVHHGIDLSSAEFAFADRGQAFKAEVSAQQ